MNIVLDDAVEINTKNSNRRPIGIISFVAYVELIIYFLFFLFLGRILLKGDCITLIQKANPDVVVEEAMTY